MTASDTLLRTALDKAKPLLDRFGIVAAPLRGLFHARRVLTVDRPVDEVRRFLADPQHGSRLFAGRATPDTALDPTGAAGGDVCWRLEPPGTAVASLRPGPDGTTEVVMEVRLEKVAEPGSRPRYSDNAGVIAVRALHRAKSLIETGEAPTLTGNPSGRAVPDPYGD